MSDGEGHTATASASPSAKNIDGLFILISYCAASAPTECAPADRISSAAMNAGSQALVIFILHVVRFLGGSQTTTGHAG
jgi:hypothetical protein